MVSVRESEIPVRVFLESFWGGRLHVHIERYRNFKHMLQ